MTLWLLGDVILPFVLGGAIAYFLDPLADRLERMGRRAPCRSLVITCVAPGLRGDRRCWSCRRSFSRPSALFDTAPKLLGQFQEFVTTAFPGRHTEDAVLRKSLTAIGRRISDRGGQLLESLLVRSPR